MAICAGITAMILGPSVVNNLTTYMLAPVSEDFGWSQSQTVLLMSSLPLFSSPFVLTFGGYLVDKVSMRTVAVWSSLIYGVAFCLMMVVPASALFGVLAVVALAGSQVCAQVVGFKTVSIWFPRHRG
ncbi:MFS transporter [Streptomyces sp. LBUM 1479]|nr:MFS transporter [Streptomyces sp. LBUM 1479]